MNLYLSGFRQITNDAFTSIIRETSIKGQVQKKDTEKEWLITIGLAVARGHVYF